MTIKNTIEAKKCPYCGAKPKYSFHYYSDWVINHRKKCYIRNSDGGQIILDIVAWNRRFNEV